MKYNLDQAIRKVIDFPKKGILFYDITSILADPKAYQYTINQMVKLYRNQGLTHILAIESRGFLFAAPLAIKLKLPLILARKKGKLPNKTIERSYSLEYGQSTLEIQELDITSNMNILLVDDLIATGGTLNAIAEMLKSRGASAKHIFAVVGLTFLNYQETLKQFSVKTLINYNSESVESI